LISRDRKREHAYSPALAPVLDSTDALRRLVAWSAENHRAFRIEELPVRFREATSVETKDIMNKWLAPLE